MLDDTLNCDTVAPCLDQWNSGMIWDFPLVQVGQNTPEMDLWHIGTSDGTVTCTNTRTQTNDDSHPPICDVAASFLTLGTA